MQDKKNNLPAATAQQGEEMIEKKLPRDWLKKRKIDLCDLRNKDQDKIFEEFAEALAKQNDLDFILDRIPYNKKFDILSDWQEGEGF